MDKWEEPSPQAPEPPRTAEGALKLEVARGAPRDIEIVAAALLDLVGSLDMSVTNAERLTRLKALSAYYDADLKRIRRGRR